MFSVTFQASLGLGYSAYAWKQQKDISEENQDAELVGYIQFQFYNCFCSASSFNYQLQNSSGLLVEAIKWTTKDGCYQASSVFPAES